MAETTFKHIGADGIAGLLRKLGGGNEAQGRFLTQGLLTVGRISVEGTDDQGFEDMVDLTAAALAGLLQSSDQEDRLLAMTCCEKVYSAAEQARNKRRP